MSHRIGWWILAHNPGKKFDLITIILIAIKLEELLIDIIWQGDLVTYNLYDRVWKIELDNAKITMDDKYKNIRGPLRFMATPLTNKATQASDASVALHDDIAVMTSVPVPKYDQLVPDAPKNKRYQKTYERNWKNNDNSKPKKRIRKTNNNKWLKYSWNQSKH